MQTEFPWSGINRGQRLLILTFNIYLLDKSGHIFGVHTLSQIQVIGPANSWNIVFLLSNPHNCSSIKGIPAGNYMLTI